MSDILNLGANALAVAGTDIKWVDTVLGASPDTGTRPGDLATQSGPELNATIVVAKGCVTPGDGGGGVFYWDPTSQEDDGGTIIVAHAAFKPAGSSVAFANTAAGAIGPCWRRIFTDYNVKYFGAVGDLATDDWLAIQTAILAAENPTVRKPGGTVFIPAGTYRIGGGNAGGQTLVIQTTIRLVGESEYSTHIYKWGPDATTINFGGFSVRFCEVSNLHFAPLDHVNNPQQHGSVIAFPSAGALGILISNIFMSDVYQGISCDVPSGAQAHAVNNVTIREVTMGGVIKCGLYAQFALNWVVSNVVINMRDRAAGTFGVWLNSYAEGWVWNGVFVGLGDSCWRFTHTAGGPRPPTEHRFYSCIADQGGRACFWASALHRSIFNGCWASTQESTLTGAFVIDSLDVRGLIWDCGQMVNLYGHGFYISAAESFTITNSTFSDWGIGASTGYFAITIAANPRMNFVISGNTFLKDNDFGGHPWYGININAGDYNKYIITNNMSYGPHGSGNLPPQWSECDTPPSATYGWVLADSGTAWCDKKFVANNF